MESNFNTEVKLGLQEIADFATFEPFHTLLNELYELPEHLRHEFVELALLDPSGYITKNSRVN
jgi:hypothetical protein